MPGVVGAWSGADLAADWGGPLPMVWPITEDIKTSDHWPHHEGQGAVPGRRRRRGRRRVAGAGERRGRGRPGGVRTAGAGPRHRGGGEGRLPDRARRVGDQRRGPLEPRRRRRPGRVRQRARAAAAPVRGAQDHAEPDRTAWRARVRGAGDGRVHPVDVDADPAHRPRHPVRHHRDPRAQVADRRARRRWGVRRQAQRLRGGGALPRARTPDRASGQVDRGPVGELRRHGAGPRGDPRRRGGGHRGGQAPRVPGEGAGRHGGVLPAPHAGDPRARGLGLHGPLRHAGLLVRVHGRHDEHGADGRRPRGRTAGGDLRRRTRGRRARAARRQGPGRDPADQLRAEPRGGEAVADGAAGRFGRLPAGVRACAGARRLRAVPQGAGVPPRERGGQADRDRALQLHRDVRAGTLEHPGCAPLCGRRLGGGAGPMPTLRQGDAQYRDLAARTGPRHRLVADRRRRARRASRRRRGPARRHVDLTPRDGHVRLALDLDRRRGAPGRAAEDQGQGADAGRARARGGRGRPRVPGRGVPRAGGARQGPNDPRAGRVGLDGARPSRRLRARPHGHRDLGPEELHLAVRDPRLRRRGRHRDGSRPSCSGTSRSTTAGW